MRSSYSRVSVVFSLFLRMIVPSLHLSSLSLSLCLSLFRVLIAVGVLAAVGVTCVRLELLLFVADRCSPLFSLNTLRVQAAPMDPDRFPFVLIGNKVDRESERRVSRQRALQWCKSKGSTVRKKPCGTWRNRWFIYRTEEIWF